MPYRGESTRYQGGFSDFFGVPPGCQSAMYLKKSNFFRCADTSSRLSDSPNLDISFNSLRLVFSLMKAVVSPILYRLLESMTCR